MTDATHAEPNAELIQGLLLAAGRLMENESAALALPLADEAVEAAACVNRLYQTASDLLALAVAAQALVRDLEKA